VTLDEALDCEALALSAGSDYEDTCRIGRRYPQYANHKAAVVPGSGLPLVCSNCGVSFFSLQITDDELECYCSGECKWSVIMYREMDRRMYALRHRGRQQLKLQSQHRHQQQQHKQHSKSCVSHRTPATYETSTTVDTECYESYHNYMDDVISCR